MSNITIQPNASGTGTFSIASPNSNTSRTLTLPDTTGELLNDASSLASGKLTGALPAIDGSALTGVGLSTLVAEDADFGTGQTVSLSLGDHTQQTFWIHPLKSDLEALRYIQLRLTDGSGTVITGNEYVSQTEITNSAVTEIDQDSYFGLESAGRMIPYPSAVNTMFLTAKIIVNNAKVTTMATIVETQFFWSNTASPTVQPAFLLSGKMQTVEANNHIVFGFTSTTGSPAYASGIKYTSIGLN